MSPLRVCLDANVWVSYLAAFSALRRSINVDLVDLIDHGEAHGIPLQLFLSWELIDTIQGVLLRLKVEPGLVPPFIDSIESLMRTGPEGLEPPLFLSGRDHLPMHDREDAGVLGACFASDVDLLITDNLADFATQDAERLDTRTMTYADGRKRKVFALIHEPIGHSALVVMHPVDALDWLGNGGKADAGPAAHELQQQARSIAVTTCAAVTGLALVPRLIPTAKSSPPISC